MVLVWSGGVIRYKGSVDTHLRRHELALSDAQYISIYHPSDSSITCHDIIYSHKITARFIFFLGIRVDTTSILLSMLSNTDTIAFIITAFHDYAIAILEVLNTLSK